MIGLFWAEKRLIKQLAFYDVVNHMHLLHVFRFPRTYQQYAAYFDRQSAHSHHIPWNKNGFFHLSGVTAAIRNCSFNATDYVAHKMLVHTNNSEFTLRVLNN